MRWRWLGATLLIVGGAYSGGNAILQHIEFWPGPLPAARDIAVPRGDTAQVADSLAAQGLIAHAWQLRLLALLTRQQGALRAGEFAFPAHAALSDVLTILRTARPVEHRLTIPEGLTARQIAPPRPPTATLRRSPRAACCHRPISTNAAPPALRCWNAPTRRWRARCNKPGRRGCPTPRSPPRATR
jgi:UPF0755 protein